jgi:hypothetical protein
MESNTEIDRGNFHFIREQFVNSSRAPPPPPAAMCASASEPSSQTQIPSMAMTTIISRPGMNLCYRCGEAGGKTRKQNRLPTAIEMLAVCELSQSFKNRIFHAAD